MKKQYLIYISLVFVLSAGLNSCKKFDVIPPPKNQLIPATVFADSVDATAAVTGIYIDMMQYFNFNFTNGAVTLYTGLSADELAESANNPDDAEFYHNAISVGNSVNSTLWPGAYKYIYDANACIAGLNGSKTISLSAKNELLGEALVIRSFLYFNLVNLYGGVPMITSTDYRITATVSRSDVTAIYTQLITDLKTARNGLPKQGINNVRANYYAATALLARIFLYMGDYPNALTYAKEVISSGLYNLESDPNNVFQTGSGETIWSLAPVLQNLQTMEGFNFAPTQSTVIPNYVITNSLYGSFEDGDLRKADWIGTNTVSGQVYPYPFKYKKGRSSDPVTESYTLIRLAEIYLIQAEAQVNTGDLAGAVSSINMIRRRAGLTDFQSNDKSQIIAAIVTERQHELFCEWGHRWFDLNRLNLAGSILGEEKSGWKNTDSLFPIPQTEISANPSLKQNPGY